MSNCKIGQKQISRESPKIHLSILQFSRSYLTQKIRFAVPQAKDIQRAEKIKGMAGYQTRMTAANKQIKAITDHEKFFRRVHAFIFNGIDCDLSGSPIFGHMATQYAKNYVKTEVKVATDRENFRKLLDSI